MNRNLLWKSLLVVFVVGWSLWEIYPPSSRNLITEFQEKAFKRDADFTNIVQRAKALEAERSNRTFANLRDALGTNDITRYFPQYAAQAQRDPNYHVLNQLQREAAGKIKLGLDLQGGSEFTVEMQTSKLSTNTTREVALENAVEVLRRRVDRFGVAEPLIQSVPGADRIIIQMPGLSEGDREGIRRVLEQAAFLEFRMVHPKSSDLVKEGLVPPGYGLMKEQRTAPDGTQYVVPMLVEKKRVSGLSGKNIRSAGVIRGNLNEPQIAFRMDAEGAAMFGRITTENVGRQMAIILDGELYSAPVINTPIVDGSGVISGGAMTEKDAFELANVLQNPLEAPVSIIQERTVDASLGKDSVNSGVRSAIYGTIAVAIFMAIYYLLAGVIANAALLLNIVILLGVMCSIGTTLTLPGIAGIVLTIGMAVDANVLIFERIREESAKGKSLRGAVAAGYDRAFSTIFDANITTLISSIILIYMGTGSVKGFGVTLTIGVIASMFTALFVTRIAFDFLLARGWLKTLPMLQIIRGGKLDFMKVAVPAFVLSWALIFVGFGYAVFVRGSNSLGIEFVGGDSQVLHFADNQKPDTEKLRKALEASGLKDPRIQYQADLAGGAETVRVASPVGTADSVLSTLTKEFPDAKFTRAGLDRIGPTIGKELQRSALVASLLSLVGILIYVAFRYEFSFAVGAVVAVIHDVLMTIGWYALTGHEFNSTMVAAVLTIIGFSINDTIVIFDRIREDLKYGVKGSFRDVINQALNQTLSRTIITSGTVFLATLSLYLFGGGAINDFAFTFLIGILTGTYSSMYIASALVLWWHHGERPKTGTQVVMETAAPVQG